MDFTPRFTLDIFKRAFPKCPQEYAKPFFGPLHKWMLHFKSNTIERMSMLLAEMSLESGDLRWWKEWDSGNDNYQEYDFRTDIGNNGVGHGALWCGRGPIQTTGQDNYRIAGQAAFEAGLIPGPEYYVNNPEMLEDKDNPEHGIFASVYYWEQKNLNYYADRGAFDKVSHIVNAGPWREGWDKSRRAREEGLKRIRDNEERRNRYFWIREILIEENQP